MGSADHPQPRSSRGLTLARWDVTSARGSSHLSTLASATEKNPGKMERKQVLLLPSATILRHQNGSKPSQKETKRAAARGDEVAWDFPEELLGLDREQSKIQSEINKTKRMEKRERKKKGKWSVITQISLVNVIGVYRLLEKQRGQMAAPRRSRAVC